MSDIRDQLTPPDLSMLLSDAKRDASLSINCVKIGTIQDYDPATQLAEIKISINQVINIDEDDIRSILEYPLLIECPVVTLQGGGDYISFPIKAGDNCIIFFNDRQIDDWLNVGDGQAPTLGRVHDLSDGMALVGVNPLTRSLSGIITDGIRISHNGDSSSMVFKDESIESIATLFKHNGDMEVTEDLTVREDVVIHKTLNVLNEDAEPVGGNFSGDLDVDGRIDGGTIHADNGATGTFTSVTVIDGIVISGG